MLKLICVSKSVDDVIDMAEQPASPGIKHLFAEANEVNKKLPKNIKWNQSFDVAKQCAEYLKDCSNMLFPTYLSCFRNFSLLLRDGLPSKVVKFLNDPSSFELKRKTDQGQDEANESSSQNYGQLVSINACEETSEANDSEPGSFLSKFNDFLSRHKADLSDDCRIKTVPGDGASASEWLLGSMSSVYCQQL